VQEVSGEKTEQWNLGSRVLRALVRWAARPTLALSVVTADVESVLYSAVFGFPARLETIFQTLVAATTTGPPRITPGLAQRPTLLPHMPRSRHTAAHVDQHSSTKCQR
jgi:hypothetical protein